MPFLQEISIIGYGLYLAAISLVTFACYGIDKYRSIKGKWRISEKALLGLSVLGGAFGGFLGMKLFRHKTKHNYFWVVNYLGIGLHTALLVIIAGK